MTKFSSPIVDAWLDGKIIKTKNGDYVTGIKLDKSNKKFPLLVDIAHGTKLFLIRNNVPTTFDGNFHDSDKKVDNCNDLIIEKPKVKKTFWFAYCFNKFCGRYETYSCWTTDNRISLEKWIDQYADKSKPYEIFEKTIEVDDE